MVHPEDTFQAIPPELAPKYHFNLSKSFYPNEEAFQKELAEASAIASDVETFRGKVASSGTELYKLAQKLERLSILTQKLYIYRYLNYAVNTALEPKLSETDQILSGVSAKVAFINTELRRLSDSDLDRLIQQEPKLALYRFFLQQNTRYKPHTLSADQEQLLTKLSPELYSWQSQLFQKLIDRTKFSEIKTDEGTFQVYRDRQILSKNKDREIRKKGLLTLYDEYAGNADLLGFIVIKQAQTLNSTGAIREFENAFESSLFDLYLSKQQLETFLTEIGKFAPLMQRYVNLRKTRIKAISGIDTVEPWDMEVIPPDFKRPQFTIQEATDVLKKALAFHGEAYSADLANLLDPTYGRLDIVKGENRVPGAFAWGYYGAPLVFYSFAYHGYIDDVLTLAHEGGHVVHYDLIYQNKIPAVYAEGPNYFTESFAMLNEFVTADYLQKNAKEKEERIFYLEQWLQFAMRRFFDIVMKSEFEYTTYKKIQAREITQADQIHQLWKEEGLKYIGEDYKRHDFLKYYWSLTPHFFTSPRYYINYLFANLMAISYFQKHLSDPSFDGKYVALMSGGFPDTPARLLQKYLDLNPFDPAAVKEAMAVYDQKLNELEALYKQ